MKTKTITVIFNNILFVIGVILLIVGFWRTTSVVLKSAMFDQYPLQVWDEGRCDDPYVYGPVESMAEAEETIQRDEERVEELRQECLSSLERQRSSKQVDDIAAASTLLISGAFLTIVFRRNLFS